MFADKLGYAQIGNTGGLVRSGPAGFYGVVAVTAVTLCTIYDSASPAGTVLWEGSLTAGQVVHFGGNGIAAKNGIYVAVGGAGTVNILYT